MSTAIIQKDEITQILKRPYTRELTRNEDGTWFARVVEFPGCMTEGETQEEALVNLDDAMASWVEVHLEDSDLIPEPLSDGSCSGKFMVRVARSMHRELVRRAEIEGVSLNQFINTQLARSLGQ